MRRLFFFKWFTPNTHRGRKDKVAFLYDAIHMLRDSPAGMLIVSILKGFSMPYLILNYPKTFLEQAPKLGQTPVFKSSDLIYSVTRIPVQGKEGDTIKLSGSAFESAILNEFKTFFDDSQRWCIQLSNRVYRCLSEDKKIYRSFYFKKEKSFLAWHADDAHPQIERFRHPRQITNKMIGFLCYKPDAEYIGNKPSICASFSISGTSTLLFHLLLCSKKNRHYLTDIIKSDKPKLIIFEFEPNFEKLTRPFMLEISCSLNVILEVTI